MNKKRKMLFKRVMSFTLAFVMLIGTVAPSIVMATEDATGIIKSTRDLDLEGKQGNKLKSEDKDTGGDKKPGDDDEATAPQTPADPTNTDPAEVELPEKIDLEILLEDNEDPNKVEKLTIANFSTDGLIDDEIVVIPANPEAGTQEKNEKRFYLTQAGLERISEELYSGYIDHVIKDIREDEKPEIKIQYNEQHPDDIEKAKFLVDLDKTGYHVRREYTLPLRFKVVATPKDSYIPNLVHRDNAVELEKFEGIKLRFKDLIKEVFGDKPITKEELKSKSDERELTIEDLLKFSDNLEFEVPEDFELVEVMGLDLETIFNKSTEYSKLDIADQNEEFLETTVKIVSDEIAINIEFMMDRYGMEEPVLTSKGEPLAKLVRMEKAYLPEGMLDEDEMLHFKSIKDFNKIAEIKDKEFLKLIKDYEFKLGKDKELIVPLTIEDEKEEGVYKVKVYSLEKDGNVLTEDEQKIATPIKEGLEELEKLLHNSKATMDDIEEALKQADKLLDKEGDIQFIPRGLAKAYRNYSRQLAGQYAALVQVTDTVEDKGLKAKERISIFEQIIKDAHYIDVDDNKIEMKLFSRILSAMDAYKNGEFIEDYIKEEVEEWLEDPNCDGRIDELMDKIKDDLINKYGVTNKDLINKQIDRIKEYVINWLLDNKPGQKLPDDFWDGLGELGQENVEVKPLPPHVIWQVDAFDVAKFEKVVEGLGVKFDEKSARLNFKHFPKEGYKAIVTIVDKNSGKVLVEKVETEGTSIKFDTTKDMDKVLVTTEFYKYYKGRLGKQVGVDSKREFTAVDNEKPVLNYAYVIEEGLVVNITDNTGLDPDSPVVYRVKGDKKFKELDDNYGYGKKIGSGSNKDRDDEYDDLFGGSYDKDNFDPYVRLDKNDYRIELSEIPETIQLVATDLFGNTLAIQIKVDEDNVVLTKNAPREVIKLVEDYDSSRYDEDRVYDDLYQTEVDKEIDLISAFEEIIEDEFDRVNTKDLVFFTEDGEELDRHQEFEEPGMYRISITSEKDFGEAIGWVSVIERPRVLSNYKISKKLEIEGNDFQAMQAIEMPVEGQIPTQLIAVLGDRYYHIDDTIEYPEIEEKDKEKVEKDGVRVRIADLKKDKVYRVDVYQVGGILDGFEDLFPEEGNVMVPNDITGHWAQNHIMNLMNNRLMYGYTDGSFGPDNMIKIREVLAVVGRIGMKLPQVAADSVADRKYDNTEGVGQAAIEFALDRLPVNIFAGKDLSEYITREDVAYVVAHFFDVQNRGYQVDLYDLQQSMYSKEIQMLIGTGAINGNPDGYFYPTLEISRAELAKMIDTIL